MAKSTKRQQASKTRSVKRKAVRASAKTRKTAKPRPAARARDPLLAPMNGTERRDIGHVKLDVARTGAARVKRIVYPPGFHWAKDMRRSPSDALPLMRRSTWRPIQNRFSWR